METVNAVGRRKAAVARVIFKEGNGAITTVVRSRFISPRQFSSTSLSSPFHSLTAPKSTTSMSILTVAATKVRQRLSVSLSRVPW